MHRQVFSSLVRLRDRWLANHALQSTDRVTRAGLRTCLAFALSVAFFVGGAFLHCYLQLPADLGLLDYLLPWTPLLIFLLIVRHAPDWFERLVGSRLAARIFWCIVFAFLTLPVSYLVCLPFFGSGVFYDEYTRVTAS